MITIKATIFLEKNLWVGTFERTDKSGYEVARHIFGGEPSDAEVYEFVLKHFDTLCFGPAHEFELKIKRVNYKRQQREVRREMEQIKKTMQPSTHAQDAMRELIELSKKKRKTFSKQEREARKEAQFLLKQSKRKEKHRGR
ncbi:YjdF family protein [Simkania negevensis]|uniref:Uncharacterized protein yjdF n=1 Tax=Simkania negevensis (strain ATCC VR-1471 / DSM 27360 / Z) TaxID=331113 RepID=F8L9H4_SIMNZ|nr:YjdF family protein [Simkania negevensis]CCB89511.1 uncharacterized protein yjdF [Simkania negevensis Z]